MPHAGFGVEQASFFVAQWWKVLFTQSAHVLGLQVGQHVSS